MVDYITTNQAANILDVTITTISRLINRGILRGQKFGPVWQVEKKSVDEYLERNSGKSKNDPTRGK